jgi:hypothetical protein
MYHKGCEKHLLLPVPSTRSESRTREFISCVRFPFVPHFFQYRFNGKTESKWEFKFKVTILNIHYKTSFIIYKFIYQMASRESSSGI